MNLIYDNIIFQLQSAGGISTYWSQLIQRLQRDKINVKFIHSASDNVAAKTLKINSDSLVDNVDSPIILNRFLKPNLKFAKSPFVFHSSYNRISSNKHAINVITVHDFIHEKFYEGLRKTLHCYQKRIAIDESKKVITVSENTKQDLLSYYPRLNTENVRVIYNGVSDEFRILHQMPRYDKPFLVFIGSREHYKNFRFSVQLVKELRQFDLYIIGKEFSPNEKALLNSIEGRFKLFTNINNDQLNELYNKAFALIYPSSYEGFGLPVLEAMKAGLPFIAYRGSSIPEIAGNAGELLEQIDIDAAKQALQKIENNRPWYIDQGLIQSKKFSWEKCYEETLKLYYEAHS